MTDWNGIAKRWTPTCGGRGAHIDCPLGENAHCLVGGTTKNDRESPWEARHGRRGPRGRLGVGFGPWRSIRGSQGSWRPVSAIKSEPEAPPSPSAVDRVLDIWEDD